MKEGLILQVILFSSTHSKSESRWLNIISSRTSPLCKSSDSHTSLCLDPEALESSLNIARDLSWFTKSLSDLQNKTQARKVLEKTSAGL